MANTTLGSLTLDGTSGNGVSKITENTADKKSDLTPEPMYGSDSNDTPVFDNGGVTKTITLSGVYVGDAASDCKVFADALDALQTGDQDSPITFVNDLRGTLRVKVSDSKTTNLGGEPNRITWSATLIQASEYG